MQDLQNAKKNKSNKRKRKVNKPDKVYPFARTTRSCEVTIFTHNFERKQNTKKTRGVKKKRV